MKKKKSKKRTYSVILASIILAVSFLPFLHDADFFQGKKGFSGYSSLRIAVWMVSLFVIAISGWIFAFINSKGKSYRFVMLLPLGMLLFQLFVYILDARKKTINDFNTKVVVNGIFIVMLVGYFFYRRNRSKN